MTDKTVDALRRKRGRPSLGGRPTTAAERKAAQRERALEDVRQAANRNSFDQVSITALFAELEASVRRGDISTVRLIGGELEKRTNLKRNQRLLSEDAYSEP